jgi:hypothetical protein
MAEENNAHEALSLLFHRDGMSNVIVMDWVKSYVQGGFRSKLCEAGCHANQTDPQTLKSNAAEGSIIELNQVMGCEMDGYGLPKRLWDECRVREAYVR